LAVPPNQMRNGRLRFGRHAVRTKSWSVYDQWSFFALGQRKHFTTSSTFFSLPEYHQSHGIR